jgi:hypothetical protein
MEARCFIGHPPFDGRRDWKPPRGTARRRSDVVGTGRLTIVAFSVLVLAVTTMSTVDAHMIQPATLDALTNSSGRIFRGECVGVQSGVAEVAGARVPVTTYTFRVAEHLKGRGGDTVTFQQAGASNPGPRDLGRLVGLPTYALGAEYVLFLLPESRAGLTSPTGAGEGAFLITGTHVRAAGGGPVPVGLAAAMTTRTMETSDGAVRYEALRRAVLQRVGQ